MNKDWQLIAWCISLEGSIGFVKNGKLLQPCIKFFNTDRSIVNTFCELVGVGGVYTNKTNGKRSNKPLHFWRCNDFDDVRHLLTNIVGYLPSKKEQATLLTEFIDLRLSKQNQWHKRGSSYSNREFEIYDKVKMLNKRGRRDD